MTKKLDDIYYMHGYDGFGDDVQRIFETIIKKYNLRVVTNNVTSIDLLSNKYNLSFSLDRLDLSVEMTYLQSKPKKTFAIWQILDHLFPNREIKKDESEGFGEDRSGKIAQIKYVLKGYGRIFADFWDSVHNSDFQWVDGLYRKTNHHYIKEIDFVTKKLPQDHIIVKLYKNNDGNWQPQLYQYLKEKNITL